MKVFIAGASGWIDSAVTHELVAHGHDVLGLARSDGSARKLADRGATPLRGDLDDLASLRGGAEQAAAVIHLANKHDFTDPVGTARAERTAVETLLGVLEGTDRPFLVASGLAMGLDRPITEHDASPHVGPDSLRGGTEALAMEYAGRGVRPIALRFPATVHGAGDHGFVAVLASIAREKGVSGYVGDGSNRWPAVHVSDAARATRLALELGESGVVHAAAEEGVRTRDIAEGLANTIGVPTVSIAPDDAAAHFGWLARIFGMDVSASSTITRERLGWTPTGPTLLADVPTY